MRRGRGVEEQSRAEMSANVSTANVSGELMRKITSRGERREVERKEGEEKERGER